MPFPQKKNGGGNSEDITVIYLFNIYGWDNDFLPVASYRSKKITLTMHGTVAAMGLLLQSISMIAATSLSYTHLRYISLGASS